MAMRNFRDKAGREWMVWATFPTAGVPSPLARFTGDRAKGGVLQAGVSEPMRGGWLTFASGDEKRRLAPVPDGWETQTDEQLARHCGMAAPVVEPAGPGTKRHSSDPVD